MWLCCVECTTPRNQRSHSPGTFSAEPQIDERDPKEDEWSYEKKLKQRRVGYSGHREVILSQAEVLKEFIPNQTLLIEVVLKREIAHIMLVRN
jgi:hypothetical protein